MSEGLVLVVVACVMLFLVAFGLGEIIGGALAIRDGAG
jgi:hypothetical protein